jgi:hypothetical protein
MPGLSLIRNSGNDLYGIIKERLGLQRKGYSRLPNHTIHRPPKQTVSYFASVFAQDDMGDYLIVRNIGDYEVDTTHKIRGNSGILIT